MLKKKSLTLKLLPFLIFVDVLETFTQFCFKKAALPESGFKIQAITDILAFIKTVSLSSYLWIGILSALLTFIIWATILSKIDLSVAVPVCSFSYITVPIVSMLFFHEKLNILRWLGIAFIILGVVLVSLSSKQKERPVL